MADEDEDEGGVEAVAALGAQILDALEAESIRVTLHNGKVVEGAVTTFSLRKKSRKGSVSWNGKLSVEIDTGVLDMDLASIASVKAK